MGSPGAKSIMVRRRSEVVRVPRSIMEQWILIGAALVVLALVAGCGTIQQASPGRAPGSDRQLTVLAAASLTGAFGTIGDRFEKAHPGVTVRFSFGSSSTLATQVTQGAPADVFAAADERTMKTVSTAGGVAGEPVIFATNTLQIAVPAGNPGHITGLRDFADPDRTTALCAPEVPCGAAAEETFRRAGITPRPVTYEKDVKAALQKVVQNEVDAALVYATDVTAAGDTVHGIDIATPDPVINSYPIATLAESADRQLAQDFVDYITSDDGRVVLEQAGFGRP